MSGARAAPVRTLFEWARALRALRLSGPDTLGRHSGAGPMNDYIASIYLREISHQSIRKPSAGTARLLTGSSTDRLGAMPGAHSVEAAIGSLQDVASAGERGTRRWCDPEGQQFVFLGREYDIPVLVASVDGLMEKADKAALEASREAGW